MTDPNDEMDTAELVAVLEQEVMGLTRTWKTFLDLYGESEERVQFLTLVGQDFFETIHYALRDAVVMGIARLVDQPDMGTYKNASLVRLVDALDKTIGECVIDESGHLLNEIQSLAEPIADARNKRIGHNDVDTIQGTYEVSLLLVDEAEECLRLMQNLLNTVAEAAVGHTTVYDTVQPGSVDTVLGYLKLGFEAEQR